MNDVTRILSAIEEGDQHATELLLPLVYDELRRLAAEKMAQEKPGQTLQATALVHEAYIRLVTPTKSPPSQREKAAPLSPTLEAGAREVTWNSRGHFFAAAAEAMRRILIERARRKATRKHGGEAQRLDLDQVPVASEHRTAELLALDEALEELERHDAQAAKLVKLRYFGGLSHQEAAEALGIGRRAADRLWALARAWLYQQIGGS